MNIIVNIPGAAGDELDGAVVELAATDDPAVFIAEVRIPAHQD